MISIIIVIIDSSGSLWMKSVKVWSTVTMSHFFYITPTHLYEHHQLQCEEWNDMQ